MRVVPNVRKIGLLLLCAASLHGCTFIDSFVPKKGAKTDVIDRQQNLEIEDFKKLSEIGRQPEADAVATAKLGAPPIPDVAQVLAAPRPPKVGNTKLVTLAVTDDVPLRDVLFELGRLANVDIEVGSGLDQKGINLRATDRPFNEVIERIATLAHLRYSVAGKAIRVERDVPYVKSYPLDFLNIVRSSTSSYNISTSILSGSSGGSGGGSGGTSGSTGSATGGNVGTSGTTGSISSQADSDLWSALEESVKEILVYDPASGEAAEGAAASAAAQTKAIINRQAGVLSVTASEAQHEMIGRFLSMMSRNSSAQVLIEAKVVEVSLDDKFQSGVQWNQILGSAGGIYTKPGIANGSVEGGATYSAGGVFGLNIGDLDMLVQAVQRFGTSRTLSSPRLSAINNQQAVLTFARNEVFFDCDIEQGASQTQTSGVGTTTTAPTIDCTTNSVPIGVVLNILPSINLDTQEVTLNIRPTLTKIVGTKNDPGTSFASKAAGLTGSDAVIGTVPVIEVRELDSVMKVKSGGVMVIGGLMEDKTIASSDGTPGLMELPVLGNLFKGRAEESTKRELVIFVKATIVNSDGSAHSSDKKVYEKFFTDPRPLFDK